MSATLLITISGRDNPGLTHAFSEVLGNAGAIILDIGQAVIHDALVLGIMVRVDIQSVSAVEHAVRSKAAELDVEARAQRIGDAE